MQDKTKIKYLFAAIFILIFKIGMDINAEIIECTICFTPGQECDKKIINHIKKAKKSILIQAYSFTSDEIAKELIKAKKRGVTVILLIDHSYRNKNLTMKMAQNFAVFIDHPYGIAHNKVMIIDGKIVLTGSYNFTMAAQKRNVENSITIISKKIAKEYTEQFIIRKKLSKKFQFED